MGLEEFHKKLGFAPLIAILIVVVLIVAGGVGYYVYKTSVDETANWETYINEKYGFEVKYPKTWSAQEKSKISSKAIYGFNEDGVPIKYIRFDSPDVGEEYRYYLTFGLRKKGEKVFLSDRTWQGLGESMKMGGRVMIGNKETITYEYVEKGKVKAILYSDNIKKATVEINGFEVRAELHIGESIGHLSTDEFDKIDLTTAPEFKTANQILSTFKFIELEGAKEEKEEAVVVPNVPMMLDLDTETTTGSPYTIGWRAIEEATNYILERDIDSSFSNPIIVSSRTLNSFSGTLSPSVSTRYYFRVKACNKYGCSSWGKQTTLWIEVIVPSIKEEEKSEPPIGKYSSPEKTHSFIIKALEEGDVDAYLESHTEESQEMLRGKVASDYLKRMAGLYREAEFKVIEKTSDMAVMAVITLEKTILPGIFIFKKEKGDWKIDFKEQFFSSLYEEEIKKGPILYRLEEIKEKARSQARDGKRVADLMQLWPALELYFSQYGGYPVLTDTSEDGEFLKILVDEGYFSQMFLDPQHPEHYYEYNGTRESFILKGYIEEEGGIIDMKDGVKDNAYTLTSILK